MIAVSSFTLVSALLLLVYTLYPMGTGVPDFLFPIVQYHVELMALMALLGLVSGLFAYSFVNATVKKQEESKKTNAHIIMGFLDSEQREVIDLLIQKQGRTTQSEIARMHGMTRLKAHRIVKKLEERGIVHVEREGKINLVRLVDELMN
jgi:CRP-like cAMP-binding protein